MIFFVVLLILTFLAQIAEFFIPPLDWMYNVRIYIVPVIVFYGAMSLPFPLVMGQAFFAGFMLDALTAQVLNNPPRVEISLGWSILLYAVLADVQPSVAGPKRPQHRPRGIPERQAPLRARRLPRPR